MYRAPIRGSKGNRLVTISGVHAQDLRFALDGGAGSDAVHRDPVYAYATACLQTDAGVYGTGFALTLGDGNDLVCTAIQALGASLVGCEIEELMADFGRVSREIADNPRWRWLGPHKGVVHLALAALSNACYDLWAKSRGVPLWRLLLDLTPRQLVDTLDLSFCEDVLAPAQAVAMLESEMAGRHERLTALGGKFPGYDTSAGWFGYSDERIRDEVLRSLDQGFRAVKLKVGSGDPRRDLRRARIVRETAGDSVTVLLDVNQQWRPDVAAARALEFGDIGPYWVEEPTHPDDLAAHVRIVREISPLRVAAGEHLPNRVVFKNYLQSGALHFAQADCVRLGGVGEFLAVSLMARKSGIPVVPHVGDMGQVHQHLVVFNRVALGDSCPFLEHIPHLSEHFRHPAVVADGSYHFPQEPGSSSDFNVSS